MPTGKIIFLNENLVIFGQENYDTLESWHPTSEVWSQGLWHSRCLRPVSSAAQNGVGDWLVVFCLVVWGF